MEAVPAPLPGDRVPLGRRKAGIGCPLLDLRRTRLATGHPLKGLADERGQRRPLKLPDVRTGDPVRQRQVIHLGQDRAGVNPVRHAMHGEAHVRIAVPDRPQDRGRPTVPGQRRGVDIERSESRHREDVRWQVPVEPENQQHVRAVRGEQCGHGTGATGQQQIHARGHVRDNGIVSLITAGAFPSRQMIPDRDAR
jgi:hypothetical protein